VDEFLLLTEWGLEMKKVLGVICVIALAGCASVSTVTVPLDTVNALQGSHLRTITYKAPNFLATTAGKAVIGAVIGGLVGGMTNLVVAGIGGKQIIAENQISDPALTIAAQLSTFFADKLRAGGTVTTSGRDWSADSTQTLSKAVGKKGLVLDVKTLQWMLGYFPTDWSHYKVTYEVRARLIHAETGKVIGQVPCTYLSDTENIAPTYEQLIGNHAALLKDKLASAATTCTEFIKRNMLSS